MTPDIRVTIMPTDTNPYGGAFGGWIISQMALGAASRASRHSKGRARIRDYQSNVPGPQYRNPFAKPDLLQTAIDSGRLIIVRG